MLLNSLTECESVGSEDVIGRPEDTKERLFNEARKYADILAIFGRIEQEGYLKLLQSTFMKILRKESDYTIQELKKFQLLTSEHTHFDIAEHFANNTQIFKKNLLLLVNILVDDTLTQLINEKSASLNPRGGNSMFETKSQGVSMTTYTHVDLAMTEPENNPYVDLLGSSSLSVSRLMLVEDEDDEVKRSIKELRFARDKPSAKGKAGTETSFHILKKRKSAVQTQQEDLFAIRGKENKEPNLRNPLVSPIRQVPGKGKATINGQPLKKSVSKNVPKVRLAVANRLVPAQKTGKIIKDSSYMSFDRSYYHTDRSGEDTMEKGGQASSIASQKSMKDLNVPVSINAVVEA